MMLKICENRRDPWGGPRRSGSIFPLRFRPQSHRERAITACH